MSSSTPLSPIENGPPQPIRLGLLPPAKAVDARQLGKIRLSAQAACAEINAAGGLLGRPIELIEAAPTLGLEAATRHLTDVLGCDVLIGNPSTPAAPSPSRPLIALDHGATLDEASPEVFRFAPLPAHNVAPAIETMARIAGPKFFIAGGRDAWSRGTTDSATRALEAIGGELVSTDHLDLDGVRIETLLDHVERSGVDVFMPCFDRKDLPALLVRFARRGLKRRIAVLASRLDESVAARLAPEVREGLFACGSYFTGLDSPSNRAYLAALRNQLGDAETPLPPVAGIGVPTYLCIGGFARAAEQAASLEPSALIRALERLELDGPQGSVRMDPVSHRVRLATHLARCTFDGTFSIIQSFGPIPEQTSASETPPQQPRNPAQGHTALPQVASNMPELAVIGADADGGITFVNRAFLRLWGFDERHNLHGVPIDTLWQSADELAAFMAQRQHQSEWQSALTARLADGTSKRLRVVGETSTHLHTDRPGYILSCFDTHAARLQQTIASYAFLAMADVAVIATDSSGTIIETNHRANDLFGYASGELLGISIHELVPPQARRQHADNLLRFQAGPSEERRMAMRTEVHGYRRDGALFPVEVSISRCDTDGETILVAALRDITDRKTAETELVWRASHDALTGLPNRDLMQERLARALARSKKQGHAVALLFIDLDGFKLINDTHGHGVGDELLRGIATRLVENVRPGDTVGRLGGDEFVVLCDQVDYSVSVVSLAERLNDALREPLDLQGGQLFATASIGLAIGHGRTHCAEELLRNADTAMYSAKEQGRDGWRLFSEEIHEQARKRLDISNGLRQAIQNAELEIRFQPILCAESQIIRGAELLLRWMPPSGEIPPSLFIPIAEMSGSIVPIGKWVFQAACEAERDWFARFGEQAPYVSVNISARQLNDESVVEAFSEILRDTRADPSRLLLELTETALMSDVTSNLRLLHRLADLGLRVAVDDFGTGYSSLVQLLRMPVSLLKIDREFVDGLDKRHDSKAIVSAVCSMARAMRLQVVAEGVENETQHGYLRDIGCDYVQGYLFHRPVPPAEFLSLLLESDAQERGAMPEDLHAVLYVSLATQPMSQDDLMDLLGFSREANRAQGITGFLLYLNGSFMQMIEGSYPRIQRLMERIEADSRHRNVTRLYEGSIDKRIFSDWSMGFRNMDHLDQGFDYKGWRARTMNFLDMSEDVHVCYNLICAFAA
ncbi:EAL domain-containing protein [Thiorhodococcus fuscus]|uniref:EAL domain-containing protein n=1 Tax=Thiorhodococcus fuscus TaxID=527200 RepID=A0ABW4YCP6_9GAMM